MFLAIVLLLAIGASALPSHRGPSNRIFGGKDAYRGQFPSLGSFKVKGRYHCAGSIIDRNTILSVAHCFYDYLDYTFDVDTVLLNGSGVSYTISQIRIHEDYNPLSFDNRIAIAKVEKDIEFGPTVSAIALQTEFVDEEAWAEFSGWGTTEDGYLAHTLQYINLKMMTLSNCRKMDLDILDSQMCTFNEGLNQGFCLGDTGGPLTVNGRLTGMASFVINGCVGGLPDVYTRVSFYIDWIERNRV